MKRLKDIKIWLLVVAFLATGSLLFGIQSIATKLNVTDPLQKEIARIRQVTKFNLDQTKDGLTINLELKKVSNLQSVLDQVQQEVQLRYKQPVRTIRITDHSNQRLQEFRYRLSFNLEEALVSGRYLQLRTALDAASGIKARIYFNRQFIYLQLEDGAYFHYEAYPRPVNGTGGNLSGGEMA